MTSSRRRCQLPAWDLHVDSTDNVLVSVAAAAGVTCAALIIINCYCIVYFAVELNDGSTDAV